MVQGAGAFGHMKRFICEQNIAHFRKLLKDAGDPAKKTALERLLAAYIRELAMLDAEEIGTDATPNAQPKRQPGDTAAVREEFLPHFDHSPHPYLLLDPGPGLRIVDVNAAYLTVTFTERDTILGKSLFDVFPDNPDHALADGVNNLYASLKTVAQTGLPHAMAVQRYDIRDASGVFVERHWQPINTPIHDADGKLVLLLHHVEDVTDQAGSGDT
jgi:PAS domain-containing protein